MKTLARILRWLYTHSLKLYPEKFRANFSEEMQSVFADTAHEAGNNPGKLLALFGREIRDWPGAVWREYLRTRRNIMNMNPNNLAWRSPTTKELLTGLALFVIPILLALWDTIFGYQPLINQVNLVIDLVLLVTILIILGLGLKHGFPRWSIPYLGASITITVMLTAVFPLWGLFAADVKRIVKYGTKTLSARIQYSALLEGFFWLAPFIALILIILLLMAWPRTRLLAKRIRQDWTLLSFMIYSGVVFALELVFEEYAYDEAWKIACWVCLALGAWIYFKNADQRKRILTLLVGVTLAYWIAAVGKWYLVPLQTWGAFHGYQYDTYSRFEFWRTLAEWGWVALFMGLPALLTLIPHPQESDSTPEENLAPA